MRFLGVYLDHNFMLDVHVDITAKSSIENLLSCLIQNFHALFQYIACHDHWPLLSRIFSLQRKRLRFIATFNYTLYVIPEFRKYQIMTMPRRYFYECLLQCHKNLIPYNLNIIIIFYWHSNQIRIDYHRLKGSRISSN